MKKLMLLLLTIFLLLPTTAVLAETPAGMDQLIQGLEKQLVSSNKEYVKDSIEIVESTNINGTVTKVLKADDPSTEVNEEQVEEYKSNLIAVLVEIKQKRDSIFYFSKTALYYYDVDNNEFLTYSNVYKNPEIESFFNDNVGHVHKNFTPGTEVKYLAIIFSSVVLAYLIFIFHNEAKTTQKIYDYRKYSTH